LITDLGPDTYLRNLLSILKGNYPTADRDRSQSTGMNSLTRGSDT